MSNASSVLKGSLLVAGTSIGGGMLALPVLTGLSGYLPSIVVYVLCWAFMACTGLLFLEVCEWMDKGANIVTMAEKTLGKAGKIFAWGIYLFLFYCLTVAYIVGCGNLVVTLFQETIPQWLGAIVFVLVFAPFVYKGVQVVSRLNFYLMLGLAFFYFLFVFLGAKYVDLRLLQFRDWSQITSALPIAFTAFAYQGIIPSLYEYMDHDLQKARKAILIGSSIPLLTYSIWQALIMGIVPIEGPGGLKAALMNGQNAVEPLRYFLKNPSVYIIGQFFAFFALLTSFLGVTVGLLDFLADGLGVEKNSKGKFILCLLIFIPPLIIAVSHPHIFLIALDFAGGFGCALLLGLLPILMVWSGRYVLNYSSKPLLGGSKWVLILLAVFVIFELVIEIYHKLS